MARPTGLTRIIDGHRYKVDGALIPSKAEAERRATAFRKVTGRRARVLPLLGHWQVYVGGKSG